jgi:hypothetical protein
MSNAAGRRQPHPIEALAEDVATLIPEMRAVVAAMWADLERSTTLIGLLRGVQDDLLISGMWQLAGTPLTWSQDFVVPFASIVVADPNGAGPLTVSTEAAGATLGAGTIQANINDVFCVPIRGRHLSITGSVANKPIFVAASTRILPVSWAKC